MKILGITAEYNPFHNGHKYHIEESRKVTGADCVVAVISGSFTQRGEAAILDKWERSRLAVDNGIDLVVELPFVYACAEAQRFAAGAVDILKGLGAEVISFGSESGDISALRKTAGLLEEKAGEIGELRTSLMKRGDSYAKAGQLAAEEIIGREAAALMLSPNNILALEYMRRINKWQKEGVNITSITVRRYGSGYLEENEGTGYAGASVIRSMKERVHFEKYVPKNVAEALAAPKHSDEQKSAAEEAAVAEKRFFELVRSEIVKSSARELRRIYRMGEGLENKLKKEIVRACDLRELLSAVVSRRYTESSVRRLLVYVLMGMRRYELPAAVYARVLAAGRIGRMLLGELKKQEGHIPLITNINKEETENFDVQECLQYDILASDMYNLLYDRDMYVFSDKVKKPYMAEL